MFTLKNKVLQKYNFYYTGERFRVLKHHLADQCCLSGIMINLKTGSSVKYH